jgi:hypothetical protein
VQHRIIIRLEDGEDGSSNTECWQSEVRALFNFGQCLRVVAQLVARTHRTPARASTAKPRIASAAPSPIRSTAIRVPSDELMSSTIAAPHLRSRHDVTVLPLTAKTWDVSKTPRAHRGLFVVLLVKRGGWWRRAAEVDRPLKGCESAGLIVPPVTFVRGHPKGPYGEIDAEAVSTPYHFEQRIVRAAEDGGSRLWRLPGQESSDPVRNFISSSGAASASWSDTGHSHLPRLPTIRSSTNLTAKASQTRARKLAFLDLGLVGQ